MNFLLFLSLDIYCVTILLMLFVCVFRDKVLSQCQSDIACHMFRLSNVSISKGTIFSCEVLGHSRGYFQVCSCLVFITRD